MRIQRLDSLVAQRIAAGEVIERPASVVRELVDNALDAQATIIEVSLIDGGLQQITVVDDGSGIAPDDLPLLCESHATSKVRVLDDLYHIKSMGFRGEALYSIAAVSRITVESSYKGGTAHRITVDNGVRSEVSEGGPLKGTIVTVEDLFYHLPARRQFLKRPSSEATVARQTIVQKALAFPQVHFRLYQNGELRLDLPKTGKKERVLDVLAINQRINPSEIVELTGGGDRFSLYAVASSPALFRSDRSHIRIYVNNRPVDEYSLVQAVTYGYGEQLPGGSFPYCYLFIEVDPTLADFNIHPTKREVKLRNKAEIHHQVVRMVSSSIKRVIPRLTTVAPEMGQDLFTPPPASPTGHSVAASARTPYRQSSKAAIDPKWFEEARALLDQGRMEVKRSSEDTDSWKQEQSTTGDFIYLGQAFNLFLIAQRGDELYLVDQHAAHERLLFDEVRSKGVVQPLAIPLEFEVERDVEAYLKQNLDLYLNLGIKVEQREELLWQLSSIPALYRTIEGEVISFIQHNTGDASEIEKGLYAIVACHASIRKGDRIDRHTAEELLEKVFALDEPVCPHGRTFVVRLSQEELERAVQRT